MTLLQRIGLILVALLLSALFGIWIGYRYATGQAAKTQVEKLETTIEVINNQIKQDTQLIAVQAQRRVHETRKAVEVEQKGVMDASLKAVTACTRDVESYGLLIRALDTANGTGDSLSVPTSLSATPETSEPLGSSDSAMGVPVN